MNLRKRIAVTLALFAAPAGSLAQATQRPIDWDALTRETQQVLVDYLRINSTNPPGNEMLTARFLKQILDREGIPAQILDSTEIGPNRANLYARLKGNGSKKAVALVHHMDVVPVVPAYWTVDPFGGVIKDGYLYGRGVNDMKGRGIMHLMAMIALKRSGLTLNRDIVFIANGDEELGSTGAYIFTKRHPELLKDVEFLTTEGADNWLEDGKLKYIAIGTSEKRAFWQHLVIKGTPSHGSRPTKLNPVPKLVAALDKIAHWETPLHVMPATDKYFRDISVLYPEPKRSWFRNITKALKNPAARDWILSDPYWNAVLRNTISLTVLNGSNKTNVIPPEASADLDIRLLPDTDPEKFLAELRKVGGDTSIHYSTISFVKPPLSSPLNTDFVRAVERAARERFPNVIVTTPMLTAGTDRPTYAPFASTYGLDPFLTERKDEQSGVHGNDERIAVSSIGFGLKFTYDILRYLQ